jgi:CheY-like chemotaxis protein/tRNA A-37 threonylcarbamoyl transferase component Bud32
MSRLLIVEDDKVLAKVVARYLVREKHTVDVVSDGNDAADRLRDIEYDLVILDCDLPHRSGLEICSEFRQNNGKSPVLMLTGRTTTQDKVAGLECGADDYLTKPFEMEELLARVKALLRRASASPAPAKKSTQKITNIKYCQTCGGCFDINTELCAVDQTPLITSQAMVDSLVGSTVGDRYQVLALIASGGMSVVYQGWHKFLNKLVAIKLLQTQYLSDPRHLRRFQLEAQALGNLKHPNIIAVSDFGMMDTQPYLVMDFVNGASLAEVIINHGELSIERAIAIFVQICNGAQHAHLQGILHRDLKPSNIMLESNPDGTETAKIVDFGIAKLLPESGLDIEKLTQTGECFGTAHYMSPEQCMGRNLDVRSDIYSMGCIMYEVLSGKAPFVGDNVLDTFQKQIHQPALAFSVMQPDCEIPDQLESLVMKALRKDAAERHQSMSELRQDLIATRTAYSNASTGI